MRILIILMLVSFNASAENKQEKLDINSRCDKNVYGQLRYGSEFTFSDTITSSSNYYVGVNSVETYYSEQYDYNGSGYFPNFPWAKELKKQNYIVYPGQTVNILRADQEYGIKYHPNERSSDNLVIKYRYKLYATLNPKQDKKQWDGPIYSTVCHHFEVTRCGDGVVDEDDGEECEINKSEESEAINNCSNECKIIANK